MESDLGSWAARRAPDLIARAEAEAVALLRDALVDAAVGARAAAAPGPEAAPATAPEPAAAERAPQSEIATPSDGELLWAYCVLAADGKPAELPVGVDPSHPVERIEAAGLAALVSRVPRAEFGAEALRKNLNELSWLERVARAHEEVLESVLQTGALVPLRLCTLYEGEDGVRRMLQQEHASLKRALEVLVGREEWGVKLLVDPTRLAAEVQETDSEAIAMAADLQGLSEAAAYMLRRRLERHVREGADTLAARLAADLRARLEVAAIDFVTRPPQNRELSHHVGDMLVNAACLVDAAELERLRGLVTEFESSHERLGVHVEVTGPWPPYNFVLGGDTATLA